MTSKKLIKVSEYYKSPIPLEEDDRFSIEELEILETEFSKYIQIIYRFRGKQLIQTQEYVGYIIFQII